jgi:hypothetical protein
MIQKIKTILILLLISHNTIFSQEVNLRSLSNFILFTSSGAIANTGASIITGTIGADAGATSLTGAWHNGTVQIQNSITAQAKLDLTALYNQLICVPKTDSLHSPIFGLDETLTPGVYSIAAAGSLADTIILDAQGNTNALFLIKFGAAFAVGAASTVILTNGARACNVFWIAEAAISIGASTKMVGTVISHTGAMAMGASGNLTGRLLNMTGPIAVGPFNAQLPNCTASALASCTNFSKAVNFGVLTDLIFFSSVGAIANTGPSIINGNIGTNSGLISIPGVTQYGATISGVAQSNTANTAQAKLDLCRLYSELICIPPTNNHSLVFAAGDTIIPGVYQINGAASVVGALTLNGLGNSNAIFIIKVMAAFSTGSGSSVFLINGARACNVFWVVESAASTGSSTNMIGTIISRNGAVSLGASSTLIGRLFALNGAIAINTFTGQRPIGTSSVITTCSNTFNCSLPIIPFPLPIDLISFSGECLSNQIRLNWETVTETNNDYFSIERSDDGINWSEIGKVNGAGNSSSSRKYFLDDLNQYNETSYYQLKQHDFSGISRSYNTISVQNCFNGDEALSIYPNPAKSVININFNGEIKQVTNSTIVDLFGRNMYQSSIYQSSINADDYQDGIYFLQLSMKSGNITRKFLIAK